MKAQSKYSCESCGRKFRDRSDLRRHQHPELRCDAKLRRVAERTCEACGDTFPTRNRLKRHLATKLHVSGNSENYILFANEVNA